MEFRATKSVAQPVASHLLLDFEIVFCSIESHYFYVVRRDHQGHPLGKFSYVSNVRYGSLAWKSGNSAEPLWTVKCGIAGVVCELGTDTGSLLIGEIGGIRYDVYQLYERLHPLLHLQQKEHSKEQDGRQVQNALNRPERDEERPR